MTLEEINRILGASIMEAARLQAQPSINGLLGSSVSDIEAQMLRDRTGMYNQAPGASEMFKLGQMTDQENQMYKAMLPEQFARSQEMQRDYDVSQGGLSGSYVVQDKSNMMQLLKNAINKFR